VKGKQCYNATRSTKGRDAKIVKLDPKAFELCTRTFPLRVRIGTTSCTTCHVAG